MEVEAVVGLAGELLGPGGTLEVSGCRPALPHRPEAGTRGSDMCPDALSPTCGERTPDATHESAGPARRDLGRHVRPVRERPINAWRSVSRCRAALSAASSTPSAAPAAPAGASCRLAPRSVSLAAGDLAGYRALLRRGRRRATDVHRPLRRAPRAARGRPAASAAQHGDAVAPAFAAVADAARRRVARARAARARRCSTSPASLLYELGELDGRRGALRGRPAPRPELPDVRGNLAEIAAPPQARAAAAAAARRRARALRAARAPRPSASPRAPRPADGPDAQRSA